MIPAVTTEDPGVLARSLTCADSFPGAGQARRALVAHGAQRSSRRNRQALGQLRRRLVEHDDAFDLTGIVLAKYRRDRALE
jgi:hypothetical protein